MCTTPTWASIFRTMLRSRYDVLHLILQYGTGKLRPKQMKGEQLRFKLLQMILSVFLSLWSLIQ